MKRIFVILLALIMVLPMCISAVAAPDTSVSCSVYTGDSSKTYNPDRQISVVLSLRNISFGDNDGVSAFEFDIYYDKNMLSPVISAAEDAEGDLFDYTSLMPSASRPEGWEGAGVLHKDEGRYSLAFSDISGSNTLVRDDELTIKIPFKTNENARVNNIVFNFDKVYAYNRDMQTYCEINVDNVVVSYAIQPASNATVPEEAIPIDVAGYRHDTTNFIYYTEKSTTVSDFVKRYCETTFNQDKLSSFAILVAGLDGVITYVDTSVSSSSNKSAVKIPANSYIIGINKENGEDYNDFKALAKVGLQVTVYNVNIEAVGKDNLAHDLNRAAFTIQDEGEEPPFVGGDDPSTPIVPVDPDVNKPDPENPQNPIDPSKPDEDFMLGDINKNKKIDMTDYILLKRAYFGTYIFDEDQKNRGDVNRNKKIDMTDYILLKRAYFGTYVLNG